MGTVEVEQVYAEIRRAVAEDRKPDFSGFFTDDIRYALSHPLKPLVFKRNINHDRYLLEVEMATAKKAVPTPADMPKKKTEYPALVAQQVESAEAKQIGEK